MKKLLSASAFSAALLFVAVAAFGADIVGTVADPSGAPIAGVKVAVENPAGVAVAATSSDTQGKYQFHGLQTGTYTLVSSGQSAVSYVGPQGLTVNWGVAHNAPAIATALPGTAVGASTALSSSSTTTLAAATTTSAEKDRERDSDGDRCHDRDGERERGDHGKKKCPKTPKD